MLTPLFQPSRLTSMNRSAGPWNHVAIIRPSSCHTVRKRSQSPASRHSTQFSTTSRICRRSSMASIDFSVYDNGLLARILDVRKLVELDVDERPAYLLDSANVHGLYDVAGFGINHDRTARTCELHPFERGHHRVGVGRATRFLEGLGDCRHAVIACARHEIRTQLGAVRFDVRLEKRLVLRRIVRI